MKQFSLSSVQMRHASWLWATVFGVLLCFLSDWIFRVQLKFLFTLLLIQNRLEQVNLYLHKLCQVAAPPNDRGVFFWPNLKPVARGKACSPGGSGVWRGGSDLYKASQLKWRPAEALTAAAVSHMAYSKTGDSEQGRKDEKIGREEGMGEVNMSDQGDITTCSKRNGEGEVVEEIMGWGGGKRIIKR